MTVDKTTDRDNQLTLIDQLLRIREKSGFWPLVTDSGEGGEGERSRQEVSGSGTRRVENMG